MNVVWIICLVVILLLAMFLVFKQVSAQKSKIYSGKAKLIARFTDEQGCFLCEFEKDGKIVNAVYGDDDPMLKVGDEVEIVDFGLCTNLPHVMDKRLYDLDLQRTSP